MIRNLVGGLAALGFVLLAAAACSGGRQSSPPAAADSPSGEAAPGALEDKTGRPDLPPLVKGPVSEDGFQAILGTGDLGVGPNRIGFLITSPDGVVSLPVVQVSLRFLGQGSLGDATDTVAADFQRWPLGSRGLYTTELSFDRPGQWSLDISVPGVDGSPKELELPFEVLREPLAPSVGSAALRTNSKTLDDVGPGTVAELATGSLHDPDLYRLSISDAVTNGRPTVIVFASPAFCTNEVCGPQLDVLQQLKTAYLDLANFVHIDFFDNPVEVQQDLDRARLSPAVVEWNLPGIEWTFVIDRDGVVTDRFEAFATYSELEDALLRVA